MGPASVHRAFRLPKSILLHSLDPRLFILRSFGLVPHHIYNLDVLFPRLISNSLRPSNPLLLITLPIPPKSPRLRDPHSCSNSFRLLGRCTIHILRRRILSIAIPLLPPLPLLLVFMSSPLMSITRTRTRGIPPRTPRSMRFCRHILRLRVQRLRPRNKHVFLLAGQLVTTASMLLLLPLESI